MADCNASYLTHANKKRHNAYLVYAGLPPQTSAQSVEDDVCTIMTHWAMKKIKKTHKLWQTDLPLAPTSNNVSACKGEGVDLGVGGWVGLSSRRGGLAFFFFTGSARCQASWGFCVPPFALYMYGHVCVYMLFSSILATSLYEYKLK